jgi:hypothetical protein
VEKRETDGARVFCHHRTDDVESTIASCDHTSQATAARRRTSSSVSGVKALRADDLLRPLLALGLIWKGEGEDVPLWFALLCFSVIAVLWLLSVLCMG